jgi:hypothetical protein
MLRPTLSDRIPSVTSISASLSPPELSKRDTERLKTSCKKSDKIPSPLFSFH